MRLDETTGLPDENERDSDPEGDARKQDYAPAADVTPTTTYDDAVQAAKTVGVSRAVYVYWCEACDTEFSFSELLHPDNALCPSCKHRLLAGGRVSPKPEKRQRKTRSDKGTKRGPRQTVEPAPRLSCDECPSGETEPCGCEPGDKACDRKLSEAMEHTFAQSEYGRYRSVVLSGTGKMLITLEVPPGGQVDEITRDGERLVRATGVNINIVGLD